MNDKTGQTFAIIKLIEKRDLKAVNL